MTIFKLDDILLIKILKYLSPNELLTTQLCNQKWKACSNSSIIWSYYLDRMWIEFDEISQPTLLDRIVDEIPIDLIRQSVTNTIIFDESQYVDDIAYSRLFMGRLLLRNRVASESNQKNMLPEWSLIINLYKATYFFSKYELLRTSILMSELMQPCRWRCYFKSKFLVGEEHGWDCSFLEDGTLLSAIHQIPMTWGLPSYDIFDGASKIQVEEYPPLRCYREGGNLKMENLYVLFVRQDPMVSYRMSCIL